LHGVVGEKEVPLNCDTHTYKDANLTQEQIDVVVTWDEKV
jgi:hypothetical protein